MRDCFSDASARPRSADLRRRLEAALQDLCTHARAGQGGYRRECGPVGCADGCRALRMAGSQAPEVPKEFLSPLSLDLMRELVVAEDGHTYGEAGPPWPYATCPLCTLDPSLPP